MVSLPHLAGQVVTHPSAPKGCSPGFSMHRPLEDIPVIIGKNTFFSEISHLNVLMYYFFCFKIETKLIIAGGYKIRNQDAIHFMTLTVVDPIAIG